MLHQVLTSATQRNEGGCAERRLFVWYKREVPGTRKDKYNHFLIQEMGLGRCPKTHWRPRLKKETPKLRKSDFKNQIEATNLKNKFNTRRENLKKFYGEDWKNYVG